MNSYHRVALPVKNRLADTIAASSLVLRRWDSLLIVIAVTIGYLAAFLWAAQDLSFRPDVQAGLIVVDDPLSRMFDRTGPVSYEAVALLDTGVVRLLVSPINIAIGAFLAILVGISLGLSYLAIVQPKSCGISAGSGLLASVPALLSGTVCCGPVVLLILGIQASALLLTLFVWLLPIGILLLLGSLVYLAGKIDLEHATATA